MAMLSARSLSQAGRCQALSSRHARAQAVEKAFVADVCAATRDVKLDEETLNGVRTARSPRVPSAVSLGA